MFFYCPFKEIYICLFNKALFFPFLIIGLLNARGDQHVGGNIIKMWKSKSCL